MQPKRVYLNRATLSDSALTEYSRLGNADAFAELYQRYLTPVYRFFFRRTGGNIALAEDLTSQVFLEALDSLPNYYERGYFAAWLFTIACRRLADYHRSNKLVFLEEIPETVFDVSDNPEDRENMERLKQLLAVLNDEKRELLQLRFSAELSFAEMAIVLGKSEAAV